MKPVIIIAIMRNRKLVSIINDNSVALSVDKSKVIGN